MVNDPVCGMAVFEDNAKVIYQGQTYCFCSTLCKQLFVREPQKHILPQGGMHL